MGYMKAKYRKDHQEIVNNFKLNDIMNINSEVKNLKLPIPFQLYETYHTNCHAYLDFVLPLKSFRDKLGLQC